MPLVINSLRGGNTHMYTSTHIPMLQTNNFMPGIKIVYKLIIHKLWYLIESVLQTYN